MLPKLLGFAFAQLRKRTTWQSMLTHRSFLVLPFASKFYDTLNSLDRVIMDIHPYLIYPYTNEHILQLGCDNHTSRILPAAPLYNLHIRQLFAIATA